MKKIISILLILFIVIGICFVSMAPAPPPGGGGCGVTFTVEGWKSRTYYDSTFTNTIVKISWAGNTNHYSIYMPITGAEGVYLESPDYGYSYETALFDIPSPSPTTETGTFEDNVQKIFIHHNDIYLMVGCRTSGCTTCQHSGLYETGLVKIWTTTSPDHSISITSTSRSMGLLTFNGIYYQYNTKKAYADNGCRADKIMVIFFNGLSYPLTEEIGRIELDSGVTMSEFSEKGYIKTLSYNDILGNYDIDGNYYVKLAIVDDDDNILAETQQYNL